LEAPFGDSEAKQVAAEHQPRRRRYTVRRWDANARRLTLDFVAHGDVGFAGRWAQRAEVGNMLQMTGPSGRYRPDPDAAWHLFVGDESALPAIAASLEVLAADKRAVVVAVVDGPGDEIDMPLVADVDMRWLHRCTAWTPEDLLVDAVAALEWQPGKVDVFVHGEAGETRAVRQHLLTERGVDKETSSISPYWRRDHTDEAWRDVKSQWLADQAADV
jgi:NADPH-dependent ferric siderophore reductase